MIGEQGEISGLPWSLRQKGSGKSDSLGILGQTVGKECSCVFPSDIYWEPVNLWLQSMGQSS
jgi:hypothetical protein